MTSDFRDHLFALDSPRLAEFRSCDPCNYVDQLRQNPLVDEALSGWTALFENSRFDGITSDGRLRPGLFALGADERAPTAPAVRAAGALLACLTADERARLTHPLDSKVWRAWMNPEFYLNRFGLRLEEVGQIIRDHVFDLVDACLSRSGARLVRDVMTMNGFLGELVGLPRLMNEYSYNINVYGTPSPTEPWGWNMWGHHLALNCLFAGGQQVLTPVFFGAEPNLIDHGKDAGLSLFGEQERAGLALAQSLTPEQAARAVLYERKRDPKMPPGRLHPGDELHLGGCFQDNREIPLEGIPGPELDEKQREKLFELVGLFLGYQPDGPRAARMTAARAHADETYFCWIGGRGNDDTFYYRIQNPVFLAEFDHHAGVFLANTEPEKFHTHTLVRTPNGNDYGVALVQQATGSASRLDGPA
jgi:hypothetical protein